MSDPNLPQHSEPAAPADPSMPPRGYDQPGFQASPPGYDLFQAPLHTGQQYPYADPAVPPFAGLPQAPGFPMPPYDATGGFVPPPAPSFLTAGGYPPPGFGYPPAPAYGYPPKTNTLAVVSLVLALVGIPGVLFSWLDIAMLGAAVVCGHIAQHQLRRTGMFEKGKGMVLASLIIAYTLIGLGIVFVIFSFIFWAVLASSD